MAAVRRVELTLNEDEVRLLYRLAVAESSEGPCLLEQPHMQHRYEAGTVLHKLSDAVLALREAEAGRG